MMLIAITGGIGSGKSVVSRMLTVMGYEVYDCDSRAKALMTSDAEVIRLLKQEFGEEVFLADGTLNRRHLAAMAFADKEALHRLNAIVHPATARDMQRWAILQANGGTNVAFIETALLRTAGLDKLVDGVWHVTAPADVRIERVMARSGLTAHQVRERINAQSIEDSVADGEQVIINDNDTALLPQVTHLLELNRTTKQ